MTDIKRYIEKPSTDVVLTTISQHLREVSAKSSEGMVKLQGDEHYDAVLAMCVPRGCPACLYDVNAPLERSWSVVSRDELMENLPNAWLQLNTRLIIDIIDLILELGVGPGHRFMKTDDEHGVIYWITSARMICFFNVEEKEEI